MSLAQWALPSCHIKGATHHTPRDVEAAKQVKAIKKDNGSKMSKSSLWSVVSKMPPECFSNLYLGFPRNVRHILADWLENQPWEFLDVSDGFCQTLTNTLLTSMLDKLRKDSQCCRNQAELIQQVRWLEEICRREPQQMVETFKGILEREKAAVIEQFHSLPRSYCLKQEELKFGMAAQSLLHKLGEAQVLHDRLKQVSEMKNATVSPTPDVVSIKVKWTSVIRDAVVYLESMQAQVLKRITIWKRQQQLSGNGAFFNEDLAPIQEKCEILFDIHIRLSQELVNARIEWGMEGFTGVPEQISNSLTTLVKSSLLVDKQPPQVLKTQTKFHASVRFLLGPKLLANQVKMPTVKASIITEKQAREMVQSQVIEAWTECAGEILNNTATMEKNPSAKVYGTNFKSLSVKKIKRCERKGSESVTEEKCAILFTFNIAVSAINMTFHLEALSLPLVVIVHGNQDNNAKATILWDNAFAEVERLPFIVAERVTWPKMCETLNMRFVSEVGTTQGLLSEHFIFLAQKVFNDNSLKVEDFQERLVSWSQFNKELIPGRGFTFWQWFDGVVELSKKCLKNYWSDKLIIGFISKQYVQKLLCSEPDGTFLLRFSDSEIGGITIAHILRNQEGAAQIQNIQPFSANDLAIRTLGDRIRDLTQLKYLYKQKVKDEAFQKHYTKDQGMTKTDGYTPATIRMVAVSNCDESQSQSSGKSIPPTHEMGTLQKENPLTNSPGYPSPMQSFPNHNILISPPLTQGNMQLPFTHGSPSPAYSPAGSMSPNTIPSFAQQYQDPLMQVDPPPFLVFSGNPNLDASNELYPTLEDVINDLFDMEELPGGVAPCLHPQNVPENDCNLEWVG
ncbi:signal transducer and activator of transcription 6 isoform X2 [Ambystoma mexicanum]|uniref:signal transducer and activator of transcription 6 isoform X2 n=2 Tax=Ambystoma mexicanum TaxID=8296 RepID=UPI0037E76298